MFITGKQFTVLISVLLFLSGCQLNASFLPDNEKAIISDPYLANISDYYGKQTDSLLLMLDSLRIKYEAEEQYASLIDLHSFISEVYQYRVNNPVKALENMNKAVEYIALNPGYDHTNPYLYINVGNILLRFDGYYPSMIAYRKAKKYAEQGNHQDALALAYLNMSFASMEMNACDSTEFYLEKAWESIPENNYMLKAQVTESLIEHTFQCNKDEDVPGLYQMARQHLSQFHEFFDKNPPSDLDRRMMFYYKLNTDLSMQMVHYHNENQLNDSVLYYLNRGLNFAVQHDNPFTAAYVYFVFARFHLQQDELSLAAEFADSALALVAGSQDYDRLNSYYQLRRNICERTGNSQKAEENDIIAANYADSLIHQQLHFGLSENQVNIANLDLILTISNLESQRRYYETTVQKQRSLIRQIVIVALVVITALFFTRRLRAQLQSVQQKLANRTREAVTVKQHQTVVPEKINPSYPKSVADEFDELVNREKVYLDPDIGLKELSVRLHTNPTYLSRMINQKYKESFTEYINNKRIGEACRIIAEAPEEEFIVIDQLLEDVGFKSKSAFYNAFKNYTGVSPAKYIQLNRK